MLRRAFLGGLGFACALGCEPDAPRGADAPPRRTLVVFAAASLRDAFETLGTTYAREHPGVEVVFNFGGTQQLRMQLEHGAVADVFASADEAHMAELANAGLVTAPRPFARNEPVIVVPRDADAVRGIADLPALDRVVVGVPEVPIGRYTLAILDRAKTRLGDDFRAKVEAKIVSRELNVKQVLAKVALGEAQAGIVYRTDVLAARDGVRAVVIEPEFNVVAEYPVAVMIRAPEHGEADLWVRFLLSTAGQGILTRHGFSGVAPSVTSR